MQLICGFVACLTLDMIGALAFDHPIVEYSMFIILEPNMVTHVQLTQVSA